MSTWRSWILGNWPLKLAALGLATVLYAGVALSDSTRTWNVPVPIEVLHAPAGGALLDLPGVVDEVKYQAPQEVANQLAADSFRASIDLSLVQPSVRAEAVPVAVDLISVDPRVRIVDYSPRSVNVRVDEVVSRTMPVTIAHDPVPEGIVLGPVMATPNRVTVTGASSRLQNVRSIEGRIPIDASGINIDQDVPIEAFDELGALVPGLQLDPTSVRVTAEVSRQLAYATLPVLPQIVGEPAHGWRVASVAVTPATVSVGGEDPGVRQLDSISTEPVDIGGKDSDLVVEVPLALPDAVTTPEESSATVSVSFVLDQGSRTVELGTALVGTSADRTYRIENPSVRAIVAGPVLSLDKLSPADLIVEVPVAGLDKGEHDITPAIQLPPDLQLVQVMPATVRVTVGQPS